MNVPSDDPYSAKIAQEKAEWDAKQKERKEKIKKSQYVVLAGIDIPFIDLVVFLVKLAIAAVPAAIIVAIFWNILAILFFSII